MRKKDDHCCKASKYPLAEPGDPLVVGAQGAAKALVRSVTWIEEVANWIAK